MGSSNDLRFYQTVVSNINFYFSGLLSSTNLTELCQTNSRLSTCPPGKLWDAHCVVPWGWFGMACLRLTLMVWASTTSLHGVQNKSLGLLSHHWQDSMISAHQNNKIGGILFLRCIWAWELRAYRRCSCTHTLPGGPLMNTWKFWLPLSLAHKLPRGGWCKTCKESFQDRKEKFSGNLSKTQWSEQPTQCALRRQYLRLKIQTYTNLLIITLELEGYPERYLKRWHLLFGKCIVPCYLQLMNMHETTTGFDFVMLPLIGERFFHLPRSSLRLDQMGLGIVL